MQVRRELAPEGIDLLDILLRLLQLPARLLLLEVAPLALKQLRPDLHHQLGHEEAAFGLRGTLDALDDYALRFDLLSIVRHIMRDEPCTIIPIVRAFVVHPTNVYGHNAQVEVTYSRNGWRAIYGAHIGGSVTNVQCYMD